jgi:hypothetical protein
MPLAKAASEGKITTKIAAARKWDKMECRGLQNPSM